jgi:AP-4 complex subunit mu-1
MCHTFCLSFLVFLIAQGYILTSEIDGTIQMKSYLTGNPEIRLALNEDLTIGGSQGPVSGMLF